MARITRSQKAQGECRILLECTLEMYPDRYGNYKFKTKNGEIYRIRFQKKTMRLEKQIPNNGMMPNAWRKIRTVSYFEGTDALMDILKFRV